MTMNDQQNSSLTAAIVALVVSIVIGICVVNLSQNEPVATQIVQTPAEQTLLDVGAISLPFHNTAEVFSGGVGIGIAGSSHEQLSFTVSGTIGSGRNQGVWRNRTGRTVLISSADIAFPSGTASSSLLVYISTSTASTVADFTAPFGSLIDGMAIATSTSLARITPNSVKNAGTNGRNVVDVQDGEYVIVALLQKESTQNTCDTTHGCESATSTNRGWTSANWHLSGHYKP